ncbi:MAG: polysaccharide biosynthesis protein [Flavobacteriaceae bacterium TMED238]|nr:MAG: polysaccharide biosynthesis protein [Flavobacteriaceae bacterium TMED238]
METIKQVLLNSSRFLKQVIASISDFIVVFCSIIFSFFIIRLQIPSPIEESFWSYSFIPVLSVLTLFLFGTYKSILRYIDLSVIFTLIKAIFIAFLIFIISSIAFEFFFKGSESIDEFILSRISFWILSLFTSLVFTVGLRLMAHFFFSSRAADKRIIIYGAGSAGIQLAEALKVSEEMQPIAFLDKNPSLHNTYLGGIKILPPRKLRKLVLKNKVDEILIAMPSASNHTLRSLIREIEEHSIKVRILPGLAELAQGKILVSELKEVDVSDLLGRTEVEADQNLIDRNIEDRVVLITGAGGSIGSEISRQVAKNSPSKLILLDSNEYSLYSIKNEIEKIAPIIDLYAVLADVTNAKRVTEIFKVFKVNTIYHAAAYKHVSLVEENPFEAVSNNIFGTQICAESAINTDVETFVLISTDKAVRPTNIMGATKRFAELILQSLSHKSKTKMTMVRFGNVIGSSGSAIPLFQKQIKEGGPVTVTHPEVIRYFMSIPEAAELVIQAGAMGTGSDVFVLDMGEPVKIFELAQRLIKLSGMEVIDDKNPDGDIEIKFTGLRPGEKLYEELLIGDNVSNTQHKRILKAQEEFLPYEELEDFLDQIKRAEESGDTASLKKILQAAIIGFTPDKEIVDIVYKHKNN